MKLDIFMEHCYKILCVCLALVAVVAFACWAFGVVPDDFFGSFINWIFCRLFPSGAYAVKFFSIGRLTASFLGGLL